MSNKKTITKNFFLFAIPNFLGMLTCAIFLKLFGQYSPTVFEDLFDNIGSNTAIYVLFAIHFVWSIVGATKFKFGRLVNPFAATSTYTSYKYRITIYKDTGEVTGKRIEENTPVPNFFLMLLSFVYDIILLSLRILILSTAGFVVFLLSPYNELDDTKKAQFLKKIITTMYVFIFLLILSTLFLFSYPTLAFKYIHFVWIIVIYSILFFDCFVLIMRFVKEFKPSHNVFLILGSVCFLMLMIIGMINPLPKNIEISSVEDFEIIHRLPSAGKNSYTLTADLDFEGQSSLAYGTIKKFSGVFDGNHHTIKNISIKGESPSIKSSKHPIYFGGKYTSYVLSESHNPFGMGLVLINAGEIKNIKFENVNLSIYPEIGGDVEHFAGIIAAHNVGTITNCIVKNSSIETNFSESFFGGIVGYDYGGQISDCTFISTEDNEVFQAPDSFHFFGGIVGECFTGTVTNCLAVQKNTNSEFRTGGLIGYCASWKDKNKSYTLTNSINCFDEDYVFKYDHDAKDLKIEYNIITLPSPIISKDDLPQGFSSWIYSEDCGCFIPSKNFS